MSVSTDEDSDGDGLPDSFEVDEEDTQQSSGGGGPLITWGSIAPNWLTGNTASVLKDFSEAPLGFVAGIVLNVLVGGLENVTEAIISAVFFLYEGDVRGSAEGMLGVADLPRVMANLLGDAGRMGGSALVDALSSFFTTIESTASVVGPFAPIIAAATMAGVIIGAAYVTRFAATLIVDSLNPL